MHKGPASARRPLLQGKQPLGWPGRCPEWLGLPAAGVSWQRALGLPTCFPSELPPTVSHPAAVPGFLPIARCPLLSSTCRVRTVPALQEKRSSYAPTDETPVRYDGLYRIVKCWRTKGKQVRTAATQGGTSKMRKVRPPRSAARLGCRTLLAGGVGTLPGAPCHICLPWTRIRRACACPLPAGLPDVPLPVCALRQRTRSLEL